jgi:hypothetical protein
VLRSAEPRLSSTNPDLLPLYARLLRWDGHVRSGQVETTLYNGLTALIMRKPLEDEMTPATLEQVLQHFSMRVARMTAVFRQPEKST